MDILLKCKEENVPFMVQYIWLNSDEDSWAYEAVNTPSPFQLNLVSICETGTVVAKIW